MEDKKAGEAPTATIKQAIMGYLQWMAEYGYTKSTQKNYRIALDHFLSFIEAGGYCWANIFSRTTLQYFKQRKGKLCACAVTSLSRYLHAQGKISAPVSLKKSPDPLPALFEDYLHYRRKYHQTPERVISGYQGDTAIHVDKRRRGRTAKNLWRWMKRRAAIEPGIGHLKREHRMDRNRLKGGDGDRINALLSAAGMNFAKLLRWVAGFLRLIYYWLFGCQRTVFALPKN